MNFNEALEKYGERKVTFVSYYKYSFLFSDGKKLYVYVGGNPEDIYKLSVEANKEYKVKELEPNLIQDNEITVYNAW